VFHRLSEVVLLDEPLSGLDPREVAHMRAFLARRRGRQTLVISSHNLHDIEVMCDRVAFIEKGKTVRVATLEEVVGTASTLVYALTAPPTDTAALSAVLPEVVLTCDETARSLTCRYDPRRLTPEAVNAKLLPVLLTSAASAASPGARTSKPNICEPHEHPSAHRSRQTRNSPQHRRDRTSLRGT
jgi:ABC-type multidrug transport system ATPase subunit